VESVSGGDEDHGAFLTVRLHDAMEIATQMERAGIVCDARGEWLRLCPDCLTRDVELRRAAEAVAKAMQK
jgi:kynureninase